MRILTWKWTPFVCLGLAVVGMAGAYFAHFFG